ncbi:hypothetical protein ACFQMA_17195 [Halosimplex aquaticum]|uniref:DUF4352 domain-containing protein n=1 Tax=Halosimplex aquaticum TaxID=3026162 RepID=A0ABD5Y5I4_9EURY|nr:hypothetical protein [Halosimplex aquaticum]
MTTFDRRSVLTALGGVAGAGVLAGCSESSGSGTDDGSNYVGDTATIDGLDLTLLAGDLRQRVTVTPRRFDEGSDGTPEGTQASRTVQSDDGRQFVVVVLRLSNGTDEPLGVPMPGGTAISEGEIYLHKRGTKSNPTDENLTQVPAEGDAPLTVGGRYAHDGTTYDRLTFALGDYQAELPAGESAAGWILYEVGADVTPDRLKLVADRNPRTVTQRAEWELANSAE